MTTVSHGAMLIDAILPDYDITEIHHVDIRAEPGRVYRAIHQVTTAELPLFRLLMGIRMLPARLAGRLSGPIAPSGPLIEWTDEIGAIIAAEPDRELVFGIAGQFWKPYGSVLARIGHARDFEGFDMPDSVRVATNFFIEPGNGMTRLHTETRIQATDERARRKFGLYWAAIYPGSSLIRREWLRAIKRRAEAAG